MSQYENLSTSERNGPIAIPPPPPALSDKGIMQATRALKSHDDVELDSDRPRKHGMENRKLINPKRSSTSVSMSDENKHDSDRKKTKKEEGSSACIYCFIGICLLMAVVVIIALGAFWLTSISETHNQSSSDEDLSNNTPFPVVLPNINSTVESVMDLLEPKNTKAPVAKLAKITKVAKNSRENNKEKPKARITADLAMSTQSAGSLNSEELSTKSNKRKNEVTSTESEATTSKLQVPEASVKTGDTTMNTVKTESNTNVETSDSKATTASSEVTTDGSVKIDSAKTASSEVSTEGSAKIDSTTIAQESDARKTTGDDRTVSEKVKKAADSTTESAVTDKSTTGIELTTT